MTVTFNMPAAPRTYTAAGLAARTEHEVLVDELADVALDLNKLAYRVAFGEVGDYTEGLADGALESVTNIISKLAEWEKRNL